MEILRDPAYRERLQLAFELSEAAEDMMRLQLRRELPHASETEIEERLFAQRLHRPGAEYGDGWGRPSKRFQDLIGKP
jgi:hypothetical protein